MDPITQQIALASAGAAGPLYVDDVFSTHLITGTGNPQTINVGINFSGAGGFLWFKNRDQLDAHIIVDTERGGPAKTIRPNADTAEVSYGTNVFGGFTSTGYVTGDSGMTGGTGEDAVYWGFRKAPGFVDIVTWTGTGSNHDISHNLGSVPGMIMVKCTSHDADWKVWHRSLDHQNSGTGYDASIILNSDQDYDPEWSISYAHWGVSAPTSTTFRVKNDPSVNQSGRTYIAYLFAHDDQRFGTDENESIIKCGKYESVYQTDVNVNLGFEPQWLLIKNIDANNHDWFLYDPMRGLTHDFDTGSRQRLIANGNATEANSSGIELNSTGFKLQGTNPSGLNTWGSGVTNRYIYVAIRRPHKPPETATDVFDVHQEYEVRTTASAWTSLSGFPTDAIWMKTNNDNFNWEADTRLTQKSAQINDTSTENNNYFDYDTQDGVKAGSVNYYGSAVSYIDYHFKRAPGFFDVACWDGTGSAQAVTHNLGAVPELIICKRRFGGTGWWYTYAAPLGNTKAVALNHDTGGYTAASFWNNTSPTSTQFTVNTNTHLNASGSKYLAYLFSSVSGISKIGSYTGTGSTYINIDCGFTNGARFVFVKRYGSSGDWYVWDTALGRGINSGNDPYLKFNSNLSQNGGYNYIDPSNPGFQVKGTSNNPINISGATYLYFAIA